MPAFGAASETPAARTDEPITVMMRHIVACRGTSVVVLAAASLGGCMNAAGEGEPAKPPTAEKLSRIIATTQQPGYWLGPRFRGLDVSAATIFTSRRGLLLTREDFSAQIDPRDCWTRIGDAVAALIGCRPQGYPQEMVIFSGDREISVMSLYTADGQDDMATCGPCAT